VSQRGGDDPGEEGYMSWVPYCDSEIENGCSDYKRIQPMPFVLRSVTACITSQQDELWRYERYEEGDLPVDPPECEEVEDLPSD
jgi:hypothetical protein